MVTTLPAWIAAVLHMAAMHHAYVNLDIMPHPQVLQAFWETALPAQQGPTLISQGLHQVLFVFIVQKEPILFRQGCLQRRFARSAHRVHTVQLWEAAPQIADACSVQAACFRLPWD